MCIHTYIYIVLLKLAPQAVYESKGGRKKKKTSDKTGR